MLSKPSNFFNKLDVVSPSADNCDKLNHYLAMDMEDMKDGLMWWYERYATFSCLSHMAQDYLSISDKCAIISVIFDTDILPFIKDC
jgi:hypothetical protein